MFWPYMMTGNKAIDENMEKFIEATMNDDHREALRHLPYLQAAIADMPGDEIAKKDCLALLLDARAELGRASSRGATKP